MPALELDDGRHVQGSLDISRALDELIPERPLFPDEPVARSAVERPERWGHDELQPVPRRIFRWAAMEDPAVRRWIAAQVERRAGAGHGRHAVQADLDAALRRVGRDRGDDPRQRPPARELLDLADALVAEGTLGGPEPNAADFQVLSSVRMLLDFEALPSAEHRPSARAARELFPQFEGEMPWFEIPGT